jgi:hypothetical protein
VECLESLNFLWFWQNDLLDGFIDLVLSRDWILMVKWFTLGEKISRELDLFCFGQVEEKRINKEL